MFRNLIAYRITEPATARVLNDWELLGKGLAKVPAHPPVASQWRTLGFDLPAPSISEELVWSGANSVCLFTLYAAERQLTGATIREHVAARAARIREREQREPYRKELAQLRDEVEADLLPRAFIKHSIIRLIATGDLLLIDTSSAKKAEDALNLLRSALGKLPVRPLAFKHDTKTWLASLAHHDNLKHVHRGETAKLVNSDKSQVTFKDVDLGGEEPQAYMDDGFKAVELSCNYLEDSKALHFKLTNQLVFKGLKFDDVIVTDALKDTDGDPAASLDANLALFTGTVLGLLNRLTAELGEEEWKRAGDTVTWEETLAALLAPIADKEGGSLAINGVEVYRSPEMSKADRREAIDTEDDFVPLQDLLPPDLDAFGGAPAEEEDEFEAARKSFNQDEDDDL